MKLPRLAATLIGAALLITGCSATGGAPRATDGAAGGGTVDTPRLVIAMVSHGAPGDTFWDLVRKGAEDAAQKDNVELRYSSNPEIPEQSNLVQNAIDSRVDGIAMTMPNAQSLGPVAQKAVDAGIPVVGLNAGMNEYQDYGMTGFFGQDESVAGASAGARLAEENAQKVLCVIHEQGNSSQEARCGGVSEGLGKQVETLYVNGMDLTSVNSTLQAKLAQDRSIDWVVGLQAGVSMAISDAADAANSEVKIATFDTNAQLMNAIRDGKIQFAIDQQPYLQGYMAVDSLWLAHRNGTTVGGGRPVYTGPAIVDATNVDVIAEAVGEGLR